jgi:hypothetical protein
MNRTAKTRPPVTAWDLLKWKRLAAFLFGRPGDAPIGMHKSLPTQTGDEATSFREPSERRRS